MNKLLLKGILLTGIILIFSSMAFAAGPASIYKVQISKFELYNGTNWITVFEGTSSTLDIAAVSAGSSAGNFFSGISVPDGTYTQSRVTPSPTFIISGNDGANYTTATVGAGGGSTPGIAAQQAECTITLTGASIPTVSDPQDFSATPITVKDGVANHKVRVSFNVSAAVQLQGDGLLYPAQPTVALSIQ